MKLTDLEKEQLDEVQNIIGINFDKVDMLKTAFTHRSYLNEKKEKGLSHNERLEFLGDAVLELIVSRFLFEKYSNKNEGDMTSFRSAIVRTESLYEEMKRLGLNKFIFMSKGEERTGGRQRPYILANTFEALIGAIYLDQGINQVEKFLKKNLFYKTTKIVKNRLDIDNKSKLQEIAQEVLRATPSYEVVNSVGPDHEKKFTSRVLINKKEFGQGEGFSKQEAEQNAARQALEEWKTLTKDASLNNR